MPVVVEDSLLIYLTHDCPSCDTTQAVAEQVARARPDVHVDLVYLDEGEVPPPIVFGVSTYVWQGRIVSLGNPHAEELLVLLDESEKRNGSYDLHG